MRIETDLEESYQQACTGGAILDLSRRAEFHLTGNDRERFFNGQITQSLRAASSGQAAYGCALDARGKMCGDFFFSTLPDAIRIDADPDLRESLAARFERYMIADDVEFADRSDEFGVLHFLSSDAAPELEFQPIAVVRNTRIGLPGWDLVFTMADFSQARDALAASNPFISDEVAEILRIENGVARWGAELTPDVLPVEAGIAARAINYEKGCYLGQEIISRLKLGTPAKSLCLLTTDSPERLIPGTEIFNPSNPEKAVGSITSSTWSFHFDKSIALGYVKRGMEQTGTVLIANSSSPIIITVQALP